MNEQTIALYFVAFFRCGDEFRYVMKGPFLTKEDAESTLDLASEGQEKIICVRLPFEVAP